MAKKNPAPEIDPRKAQTAAQAEPSQHMKTLDQWCVEYGDPDPEVVAELFDTVEVADLSEQGRRTDSATLYDAVPGFFAAVTESLASLSNEQRRKLVGFDASWLPVLAHESRRLRGLNERFSAQDAAATRELAKRRQSAAVAWTDCVTIRDQAVRNLRRAAGSRAESRAQIDDAVGTARSITTLVTGTNAVADTLEEFLAEKEPDTGKPTTLARLLVRSKLDGAYVAELRQNAKDANDRDAEAKATKADLVTQDEIDLQDGRVMRVAEWIWRAFREASNRDGAIRVPSPGAMESLFVTRRSAKEASDPTPVKPT